MLDLFFILRFAPTQPQLDGIKNLSVANVADGLESQGGWYLAAVMLFVSLWAVRGRLAQQKESADAIDALNTRHYNQAKEQTSELLSYMQARDAEVRELLAESTLTTAEVAQSITMISADLREIRDEIRHKLKSKAKS